MNDALLKWYKQMREQNVPINGVVLKEKFTCFAKEFGLDREFKASEGILKVHSYNPFWVQFYTLSIRLTVLWVDF